MSNQVFHTASLLLSAAVIELFPDAQHLGSGVESIGFYSDFEFSQPFNPEYLPLIEERMKAIVARDPSIRHFEMVPMSAKALFENAGQRRLIENFSMEKGTLIQLCQIERFVDLCRGPLLKNWKQLGGYMLTEYQNLSEGTVRLFGIASSNLQELQTFSKKLKKYAKTNHLAQGKERQLFVADKGWCFYPLGVRLRQNILNYWSRECAREGYLELVASKNFIHPHLQKSAYCTTQNEDIAREEKRFLGLFAPSEYLIDRFHFSSSESELLPRLISSLQFARKFSRIFGFDPKWILGKKSHPLIRQALEQCEFSFSEENGRGIEWRFPDGLGRAWTIGFLHIEKGNVLFSLFCALERFIALLLEKEEGKLPFWLDPELVRIVAPTVDHRLQASSLQAILEKEGFSCTVDEGNQRQPLLQKVPYVIFLGKYKAEADRVAVQMADSNCKEEMSIDAFMQYLRKKIESQ